MNSHIMNFHVPTAHLQQLPMITVPLLPFILFFLFISFEGIVLTYCLMSLGQNCILEKYVMLTLKYNELLNVIV